MAQINIEHTGTCGKITVDGVQLKCVTEAVVHVKAGEAPAVVVKMGGMDGSFDLSGAQLRIEGLEVGAEVEQALLQYLARKYPLTTACAKTFAGLGL